ncbi:MAG TPA: hypothetical protein VEA16_10985 [Vicinamibacterales bacterium]|nr:hypothetical protein [Vicinamibacterales bacterium]
MTRGELLATLARRTGKNASSLDTATQTRFLEFLNETHRDLLSEPGMERLRRATTTFDSVSGTATYTISSMARVDRVWETTNDRRLFELSIDQYRTIEPDTAANTGTPTHFVWLGVTAVSSNLLALWPTPAAAITYTVEGLSVIADLANDSSTPLLPLDFHDLLVLGALMREYEKGDDARYRIAVNRYDKRVKDLKYWLAETATGTAGGSREWTRFNGGWYPAR